ncbi:hypothetical protein M3Y97_00305000 [Aphelenchoides bicaudatus]|nr:hypothetical protein M3Y97_00305000 [Aphelenchoides bicaudatus]
MLNIHDLTGCIMETHKSSQIKLGSPRSTGRSTRYGNSLSSPNRLSPPKHKGRSIGGRSPKRGSRSPAKASQEERPIYIMELPAVEHKFKCPECSHDTYKRVNFIQHAKKEHSRDYEIFYQCIGCRKRFEQIRECMTHVSACNRVQKAVDIEADKDKRKTRSLRSGASPLTFKPFNTDKEPGKPSALIEPKRVNDSKEKQIEPTKNQEAELFNLNSSQKRNAQNEESTSEPFSVLLKVPREDERFYCPQCTKDFIRKDRTINHCVSEHGRSINFAFQCSYCDKTFDELRNSSIHIKFCPKAKNAAKTEQKQSAGPSKPLINHRQSLPQRPSPYTVPTTSKSRDGSYRPSSSNESTWEMIFFTELGRSLVQNPQSAESLVKVVPIMRQITKEVVTKLGHSSE